MGAHARYHNVDFINGEHNATDAQRVYRRVHGPKPDRVGRVELVQLNALAIGSPHHRQGGPDILQADKSRHRWPFDRCLALEPEAQLDEERLGRFEVVDHDENVVHSFKRHVLLSIASLLMPVLGKQADPPRVN